MPLGAFAFTPLGDTVTFTASITAPVAVQAVSVSGKQTSLLYRIVNTGTVTVFLGVGPDNASATAATTSVAAGAIPIPPNTVEVLGFPAGSFFTGKVTSGTAIVYVTPGKYL